MAPYWLTRLAPSAPGGAWTTTRFQVAGVRAARRVVLTPAGLLPFPVGVVAGGTELAEFVAVGISLLLGALSAGA